jgi:hypothetical protein
VPKSAYPNDKYPPYMQGATYVASRHFYKLLLFSFNLNNGYYFFTNKIIFPAKQFFISNKSDILDPKPNPFYRSPRDEKLNKLKR